MVGTNGTGAQGNQECKVKLHWMLWTFFQWMAAFPQKLGPFSIYEHPKYKPNLTLTLTLTLTLILTLTLTLIQTLILILTQILTLKPTWVDATIRSHFGCSYIEKEPTPLTRTPANPNYFPPPLGVRVSGVLL